MVTPAQLEVYRQACESYRFHYRLEWQFLQVGVAIGLVILGLGKEAYSPQAWQFFISGFVFLGFSLAMHRVSKANADSRPSFIRYARHVGDERVQAIGPWQMSAAVWGRLILHFIEYSVYRVIDHLLSMHPDWKLPQRNPIKTTMPTCNPNRDKCA